MFRTKFATDEAAATTFDAVLVTKLSMLILEKESTSSVLLIFWFVITVDDTALIGDKTVAPPEAVAAIVGERLTFLPDPLEKWSTNDWLTND